MKNRFTNTTTTESEPRFGLKLFMKNAIYGIFAGVLFLLIFAIMFRFSGISDDYLWVFSLISIFTGAFITGRRTGMEMGGRGLLCGIFSGFSYLILLYLIGCLICMGFHPIQSILWGILVGFLGALAGSVSGVGKGSKRR